MQGMKSPLIFAAAVLGGVMANPSMHLLYADDGFAKTFHATKEDLSSLGSSRYFVLQPGFQLVYQGEEDGKQTVLTITVLKETRVVDGVETRVVEERESHGGTLAEVSRNYFAISKRTGDVYYFGEDVDMYKNGKVTSHESSWLAGKNGAHFGLGMPGAPKAGQRYYQEVAPGLALDRAEIVGTNETVETPAGKFTGCLKTRETSALETGTEYKFYAPGIGMATEGSLKLVKHGFTTTK